MKKENIRLLTFFIILIFAKVFCYSQETYSIDYYGVVSSEIDSNIYKMTSDLYYTQLSEINDFMVTDKRTNTALTQAPENTSLSTSNLSFYAEIEKSKNSSTWIATLNIIDRKNNLTKKESKEYDSYYKILMEPKSVLKESLRNLIIQNTSVSIEKPLITDSPVVEIETDSDGATLESLAGTWTGEKGISKIVIMRGARGFVIFENGASMNILLTLENTDKIIISQNGKSNASFYPDIPRQIALNAALNSDPIKWTFILTDGNKLSGTKNTLVFVDNEAVKGEVNVVWQKRD